MKSTEKIIIVGITGGIGSGKTTISKLFNELGIPVYISDIEAKKILNTKSVIEQIKNKIGKEVIENNIVNKQKLANIVFKSKEKLNILNSIIHPEVKNDFEKWLSNIHQNVPFIIKESAILLESNAYMDCDIIITVSCPENERINRILKRDKTTINDIKNRIRNQLTDEEREKKADYIINSNTSLNIIEQKVNELYTKLISKI